MAKAGTEVFQTNCDKEAGESLMNGLKRLVMAFNEFNKEFSEFLEKQKKLSKDIWNLVTRYNILDSGPPCVYPIIQKDELLQEMLTKIQEMTSELFQSLVAIKSKFDNIPRLHKTVEKESQIIDWDPTRNPFVKGTVKHLPPSQYLEDIADIIFQFDVLVTCMFQYFDALNLHEPKTYERLMKSFVVTSEVTNFVKEFLINSKTLLV